MDSVQPHEFLSHHGYANIPKSRMVNLDNSDAVSLPKASGDMGDMGCDLLSLPLPFHALWVGMAAHPHMSSFSSKVPQRV